LTTADDVPASAPDFMVVADRLTVDLRTDDRSPESRRPRRLIGSDRSGTGVYRLDRREHGQRPHDQRSIRRQSMSDDSGPSEGVKGVVEGLKGKAKEVVGAVTGQDDMAREGRAQQDKAEDQRQVAQKEAEADKARAEA